jgi:hypothetical protein
MMKTCILSFFIIFLSLFGSNPANANKTDDEITGDRLQLGIPILALAHTFLEHNSSRYSSLFFSGNSTSSNEAIKSRDMLLKSLITVLIKKDQMVEAVVHFHQVIRLSHLLLQDSCISAMDLVMACPPI